MRTILVAIFLYLASTGSALGEPVVKVVNFTADWCPNCRILNPRLDEAISAFPGEEIVRVDLDVTEIRRGSSALEKAAVETRLLQKADTHKVAYLWNWYGGITGLAVAVAADTGEPIACFMRPMTARQIEERLNLAKILAEKAKPGTRKPKRWACPQPMR
jgi:thiol-disulfide isomerase/thioredoxin